MPRFSIRAVLVLIVVSAVVLVALRNANEFWAGVLPLITWNFAGIAALGAIFLRGPHRAWWTGFGLVSGVFLVFALVPWFPAKFGTAHPFSSIYAR